MNNDSVGTHLNDSRLLHVELGSGASENAVQYPCTKPMNDADLFAFIFRVLLPVVYQYNPEIVVVSLSFEKGKGTAIPNQCYVK